MIYNLKGKTPQIKKNVFIAPSADVIGDVCIGSCSSIWFHCTIRGDGFPIRIGEYTNIQDNTVIHIATNEQETIIGDHVTIGHSSIIHAAHLKDHSFIGMGSIILDKANVAEYGFVAAGTLVPPNFEVPEKTLVAGVPARIIRSLKETEIEMIQKSSLDYHENAIYFMKNLKLS